MLLASLVFLLFAGPSALDEKAPSTTLVEPIAERGSPAFFSWADVDGDGRLDLAAVSPEGVLQLLASTGEGRFEDVTERAGLTGIADAALALWVDYDSDGRQDLFIGARAGASRLFRNEAGVFVDMTEGSGLVCAGAVRSAEWLDHDGDGRPDLHVLTAERHELYRGLEGGFFERTELPLVGCAPGPGGVRVGAEASGAPPAPGWSSDERRVRGGASISGAVRVDGVSASGGRIALGPSPSAGGATLLAFPTGCASSIRDEANPGTCLQASTTPTLGRLYPISSNLFVAVAGDVGIGTTSPAARLHVAGTARITDTLTLAPSSDQALDVSTGSIYKAGALFIHTKGGGFNTALGREALGNVTTGIRNTAVGHRALYSHSFGNSNTASGYWALRDNIGGSYNTAAGSGTLSLNTTGSFNTASGASALVYNNGDENTANGAFALFLNSGSLNTACGAFALRSNVTGGLNTASGRDALRDNGSGASNTASGGFALRSNTTGICNTASGAFALRSNTTGHYNTAIGHRALYNHTSGDRNTALGRNAGQARTSGSDNIDIGNAGVASESGTMRIGTAGTQTRAFVSGIRGVTTGVADAIPVLIDSAGQLGTVSSSRRFKKDIADMGDATERLLRLRPVVFHYKQEQTLPNGAEVPLEYGLIAEEVAEVFPELVVHDEDGEPFTVKYHLLSSMLLNELKEQAGELAEQSHELVELRQRLAALEGRVAMAGASSGSH